MWTVKDETDEDPFNLDQKAVRWVVLIRVKNNFPCHGQSSVWFGWFGCVLRPIDSEVI